MQAASASVPPKAIDDQIFRILYPALAIPLTNSVHEAMPTHKLKALNPAGGWSFHWLRYVV